MALAPSDYITNLVLLTTGVVAREPPRISPFAAQRLPVALVFGGAEKLDFHVLYQIEDDQSRLIAERLQQCGQANLPRLDRYRVLTNSRRNFDTNFCLPRRLSNF